MTNTDTPANRLTASFESRLPPAPNGNQRCQTARRAPGRNAGQELTTMAQHTTSTAPDTAPVLPARVDRRRGAAIITHRYFPVSHRTLESWPLTWRRVNGRALVDTAELLAFAEAKLAAAPPVRGGKRNP